MQENRKGKSFLVVKYITIIIIFIALFTAISLITYYSSIKTEEKILGVEEVLDIRNQIIYLMNNGYNDKDMQDISTAYDNLLKEMAPVEEIYYVDFAKVKQKYRTDKKYGWVPIGIPEIVIFFNQ